MSQIGLTIGVFHAEAGFKTSSSGARPCTARGKFPVNHNGRYAPYSIGLCRGSTFRLVHVVNYDLLLAFSPLIQGGSRMRLSACTDLCGGQSANDRPYRVLDDRRIDSGYIATKPRA